MASASSLQAEGRPVVRRQSPQGVYLLSRLSVIFMNLLLLVLLPAACARRLHKKQTIEYYLHSVANESAYTILKPVSQRGFTGSTTVYNNPITKGPESSSKRIGFISGLEVETSVGQPFSFVLILNTVTYDDGVYKGSFEQQGVLNYNVDSSRLAVVGGTGDFLGVYGYGQRHYVSNTLVNGLNTTVVYFKTYIFR